MLSILEIGVALPSGRERVEDAGRAIGLSPSQVKLFRRLFGFDELPFDPGQPLGGMMGAALDDLDRRRPGAVASAGLVLHCHTVPAAVPCGHPVAGVAPGRLAPDAESASLTMSHCATGLSALALADALLVPGERALVLVGEKAFHPRIRLIKDTTIMGEAAVAVLLGREPGRLVVLGTHTRHDGVASVSRGHPGEEPGLGRSYTEAVATHVVEALGRFGIALDAVALVLPHNVNMASWLAVARGLGLPPGRLYLGNVGRLGHCFGADPFLNACDALAEGRIVQGDLVLMVSVGMGMSLSCTLARVSEPPGDGRRAAIPHPAPAREVPIHAD